jgi:hypothetical protein
MLRAGDSVLLWLCLDRPDEARRQVAEASEECPKQGFHVEHYHVAYALILIDLYEGRYDEAERRRADLLPPLGRSLLLRVQVLRLALGNVTAAMNIGLASRDPARRAGALGAAARAVRSLRRERNPLGEGIAALHAAALADIRGESAGTVAAQLRDAARLLASLGIWTLEVVARRYLGIVIGGDEGRAMTAAAEEWMRDQGIVDPVKFARMWLPAESRFARKARGEPSS